MRAAHENVRLVRESKGINKTFVAKKLGLSLQGYIHVENGNVSLSAERLRSIAEILAEDIGVFFDDELTETVIRLRDAAGSRAQ